MKTIDKKIEESKEIIKEAEENIKKEKEKIRKRKKAIFKSGKFYKIIKPIIEPFASKEKKYTFSESLFATTLSFLLGGFICFSVISILCHGTDFIKTTKKLDKFIDAYETLVDNYYGYIDENTLIDDAITGMLSNIDDKYTEYSNSKDTSEFNELVKGTYEGIGCTILQNEANISIYEIYENSPAEKAGLKKDDIILKVDGIDAKTVSIDALSNYIKTEAKENISMTILRDKKEKEISITREKVEMPAVSSKIIDKEGKKIGYLEITLFTSVASKQFGKKLLELEKQNISGLVIDVRGNSGGYLSTVVDIVSQLLPRGKVIYQIEKNDKITSHKDKTNEHRTYPIAVLVNGASASASEILASSIKESYGGFVVGTITFGKGTVQQIKELSDGSMIKYTVENWMSPNGNWINKKGVTPTHFVSLTEEYINNPKDELDSQLQKALELVSK